MKYNSKTETLRNFLDSINSETPQPTISPEPDQEYQTVVKQLNSISWQLKRIADALERK